MKVAFISFSFGEGYKEITSRMISSIKKHIKGCEDLEVFVVSDQLFENAKCYLVEDPQDSTFVKMNKYSWIIDLKDKLNYFDLLYVIDADCVAVNDIYLQEILPRQKDSVICVTHPWQISGKNERLVDSNPNSNAYLKNIDTYIQSCFFGAYKETLLFLSVKLANWAVEDRSKNIVPKWFDESYLNKYITQNDVTYLGQEYACPSTFSLDLPDFVSYSNSDKNSVKIVHFNFHTGCHDLSVLDN